MDVINGSKKIKVAGAKIGEEIMIHLMTGKIEKVILSEINRNGIEGFEVNLKDQPLTFYPFTAILKVKKHNEIQG